MLSNTYYLEACNGYWLLKIYSRNKKSNSVLYGKKYTLILSCTCILIFSFFPLIENVSIINDISAQNYLLTKETATEEEEEFSPNEDTITQDSLQTEDPATESMLPIMVISKAKLQWRNRKSQNADNLKSAWKNALEIATGRDAVKNELPTSNETDEQRKRRCVSVFILTFGCAKNKRKIEMSVSDIVN